MTPTEYILVNMKSKKPPNPTKKDKEWQKKIEDSTKAEKVELDHPKGKERFEKVVKRMSKKKN